MATLKIEWIKERIADLVPLDWFLKPASQKNRTHDVRDQSGRISQARCDLKIGKTSATLDYKPHRNFNDGQGWDSEVMRITFASEARDRVNKITWGGQTIDFQIKGDLENENRGRRVLYLEHQRLQKEIGQRLGRQLLGATEEVPMVAYDGSEGGWHIALNLKDFRSTMVLSRTLELNGKTPAFWYGLCADGKTETESLARLIDGRFPNRLTISEVDYTHEVDGQVSHIEDTGFQRRACSDVLVEDYTRSQKSSSLYVGMYQLERTLNVARAADFLLALIKGNPDLYAGTEGGRTHRTIEVRNRDSAAARLCKQRDGHKCRICGFHSPSDYAPLAHHVVEAHHIVKLSAIDQEHEVKPSHLITVCPNCHRMLHRMNGEGKMDIAELTRIVKVVEESRKRSTVKGKEARLLPRPRRVAVH